MLVQVLASCKKMILSNCFLEENRTLKSLRTHGFKVVFSRGRVSLEERKEPADQNIKPLDFSNLEKTT